MVTVDNDSATCSGESSSSSSSVIAVPDPAIHGKYAAGGYRYVLTSYSRDLSTGIDDPEAAAAAVRAARFLERSTFGPTRSEINSLALSVQTLASTSGVDNGDEAFVAWVEDQMDEAKTPPTPHQAWLRRNLNPRSEYSYYLTGPGPAKACMESSRWCVHTAYSICYVCD